MSCKHYNSNCNFVPACLLKYQISPTNTYDLGFSNLIGRKQYLLT